MALILVIDDDRSLTEMLSTQLREIGHEPIAAHTIAEGLAVMRERAVDVVLLDVQLPDGNGLEYIPTITSTSSKPEVIIITGHGEADGAEKAIISGAWSYIEKPYAIRELPLQLIRVLQYRYEKMRVTTVPFALKRDNIIGSSPLLKRCLDQVARAAATNVSVLVTGSTGTGKELFARAIHDNSKRVGGNFVVVDCAALPETLIESTLFGHVKGAFTNADTTRDGLVKHADGGTLFLDEVGEMPLPVQKTFLRLLQEHSYRPVGSTSEVHSDFRLVAATNRDLDADVRAGIFREDLLFRLQAFPIELPPLKDRREDIRELVLYFVARLCRRFGLAVKGVSTDFIETLTAYDWPGNVRELLQTMEQVFTNPQLGSTCFAVHLPERFRILQARAGLKQAEQPASRQPIIADLPRWGDYKQKCEADYLIRLKAVCGGNVTEASRRSGLSRTRLYQLLEKYQIDFS